MLYVEKPQPVEAVFLDSIQTALEFLNTGEFVLIASDSITLRHGSGELLRAQVGKDYILRTDDGVEPVAKEVFENSFVSLDQVADAGSFTAHQNEDHTWTIECTNCGPVGCCDCDSEDGFLPIGMEHMEQSHGGLR